VVGDVANSASPGSFNPAPSWRHRQTLSSRRQNALVDPSKGFTW